MVFNKYLLAGAMVLSLAALSSYAYADGITVGNPGPAASDVRTMSMEDEAPAVAQPAPTPPAPAKKVHHHKKKPAAKPATPPAQ